MIVYKDKTFCDSSDTCVNYSCWRHLSEEDKKNSGRIGLPICFADFKDNSDYCEGYIQKEDSE